jgi:hypothetical protein
MARLALQALLIALGVAAIAIGSSIFFLGATFTGATNEALFNLLSGGTETSPPFTPTVDSELRFYAPFWVLYGAGLVWVARGLAERLRWVPPLAGLFFAGGVGRLISLAAVGPPHPAFTMLMVIELVLPAVFVGLWTVARRGPG